MNRSDERRWLRVARPLRAGAGMEMLEGRRLLSVAVTRAGSRDVVATQQANVASETVATTPDDGSIRSSVRDPIVANRDPRLSGTVVHAIAGQQFTAVVGHVQRLFDPTATTASGSTSVVGWTLSGVIDWGDGTTPSAAKFVRQADGSFAVEGTHTYASAGAAKIAVTVMRSGPPGTAVPVVLVGRFQSVADVLKPEGGFTLNATSARAFSGFLGTFTTDRPSTQLGALINWGDGTSSQGKIIALPVLDPTSTSPVAGNRLAVSGEHTYARPGSYVVSVTVFARATPPPTTTTDPVSSTALILVTRFRAVLDVLPPELIPVTTTDPTAVS